MKLFLALLLLAVSTGVKGVKNARVTTTTSKVAVADSKDLPDSIVPRNGNDTGSSDKDHGSDDDGEDSEHSYVSLQTFASYIDEASYCTAHEIDKSEQVDVSDCESMALTKAGRNANIDSDDGDKYPNGPCEVWINGKLVTSESDCPVEDNSDKYPLLNVDFSSCKPTCSVEFYWVQQYGTTYQIYMDCFKGNINDSESSSTPPQPSDDDTAISVPSPSPAPARPDVDSLDIPDTSDFISDDSPATTVPPDVSTDFDYDYDWSRFSQAGLSFQDDPSKSSGNRSPDSDY